MNKKRSLITQLIFTMLLAVLLGTTAFAASAPKVAKKLSLIEGMSGEIALVNNQGDTFKAANIKVGNKNIISAKSDTGRDANGKAFYAISIQAKKKGTTTLKFNLKVNGKTVKYSVKVTVAKFQNPFTTLKIGSGSYAARFASKTSDLNYPVARDLSGKLNIKLRSGWKLESVKLCKGEAGSGSVVKSVKNGATVKIGQNQYIEITVWRKEGDIRRTYTISVPQREAVPSKVEEPYIPTEVTILCGAKYTEAGFSMESGGVPLQYKDVKVKNSKILSVKMAKDDQLPYDILSMTGKKAGTTTVSFKMKVNGTWKSYSVKVTVRKYENPFSSIKIGSKNYTSKFKNSRVLISKSNLKGKLSIKLKSGWKLEVIYKYTPNGATKLKNNQSVTLKKNDGSKLMILLKNTKQNYEFPITVYVE